MNNEEKILEMLTQMQEEQKHVREDITGIKLRLELNVDKQLKLLSEGQANILEHIDEKVTDRTESLQDQIDVLRAATMQNSRDIEELKAAQ